MLSKTGPKLEEGKQAVAVVNCYYTSAKAPSIHIFIFHPRMFEVQVISFKPPCCRTCFQAFWADSISKLCSHTAAEAASFTTIATGAIKTLHWHNKNSETPSQSLPRSQGSH